MKKKYINLRYLRMFLIAIFALLILCSCGKNNGGNGEDNKKDDPVKEEHVFDTNWSKDETYHFHVCLNDGCSEVASKAAHAFDSGVVTKEPTEEDTGIMTYTCSVCGYTKTEVIDAKPHEHRYDTEWTIDETYHYYKCLKENCDGISEKAAHTFDEGVVTKEATEEDTGIMTYTCTACGYTKTEVINVKAHEHKYATEWTIDETYHYHKCLKETCDGVSEKAAHTFDKGVIITAADYGKTGEMKYTCTVCGYTKTETIAALDALTNEINNVGSISKIYDGTVVTVPAYTALNKENVTYTWYEKDSKGVAQKIDNAPKNVGNYLLKIEIPATKQYTKAEYMLDFAISAKEVVISYSAINRAYDGTKIVQLKDVTLNGIVTGDNVTIDDSQCSATVADLNVGEDKPVTVTGFALTGSDVKNYTLQILANVTVTITKAQPTYELPVILVMQNTVLKDIDLGTGFSFVEDSETVLSEAGTITLHVNYTPSDTLHYETITNIELVITVEALKELEVMKISVNPALQFIFDEYGVVKVAQAMDDAGLDLLSSISFIGKTPIETIQAFLDGAIAKGYLANKGITYQLYIAYTNETDLATLVTDTNSYITSKQLNMTISPNAIDSNNLKETLLEFINTTEIDPLTITINDIMEIIRKNEEETQDLLNNDLKQLYFYTLSQQEYLARLNALYELLQKDTTIDPNVLSQVSGFIALFEQYSEGFKEAYKSYYLKQNSPYNIYRSMAKLYKNAMNENSAEYGEMYEMLSSIITMMGISYNSNMASGHTDLLGLWALLNESYGATITANKELIESKAAEVKETFKTNFLNEFKDYNYNVYKENKIQLEGTIYNTCIDLSNNLTYVFTKEDVEFLTTSYTGTQTYYACYLYEGALDTNEAIEAATPIEIYYLQSTGVYEIVVALEEIMFREDVGTGKLIKCDFIPEGTVTYVYNVTESGSSYTYGFNVMGEEDSQKIGYLYMGNYVKEDLMSNTIHAVEKFSWTINNDVITISLLGNEKTFKIFEGNILKEAYAITDYDYYYVDSKNNKTYFFVQTDSEAQLGIAYVAEEVLTEDQVSTYGFTNLEDYYCNEEKIIIEEIYLVLVVDNGKVLKKYVTDTTACTAVYHYYYDEFNHYTYAVDGSLLYVFHDIYSLEQVQSGLYEYKNNFTYEINESVLTIHTTPYEYYIIGQNGYVSPYYGVAVSYYTGEYSTYVFYEDGTINKFYGKKFNNISEIAGVPASSVHYCEWEIKNTIICIKNNSSLEYDSTLQCNASYFVVNENKELTLVKNPILAKNNVIYLYTTDTYTIYFTDGSKAYKANGVHEENEFTSTTLGFVSCSPFKEYSDRIVVEELGLILKVKSGKQLEKVIFNSSTITTVYDLVYGEETVTYGMNDQSVFVFSKQLTLAEAKQTTDLEYVEYPYTLADNILTFNDKSYQILDNLLYRYYGEIKYYFSGELEGAMTGTFLFTKDGNVYYHESLIELEAIELSNIDFEEFAEWTEAINGIITMTNDSMPEEITLRVNTGKVLKQIYVIRGTLAYYYSDGTKTYYFSSNIGEIQYVYIIDGVYTEETFPSVLPDAVARYTYSVEAGETNSICLISELDLRFETTQTKELTIIQ